MGIRLATSLHNFRCASLLTCDNDERLKKLWVRAGKKSFFADLRGTG